MSTTTDTTDEHKNPRSVSSNVMLTFFGVSTIPVNILPAVISDPKELKIVCPTCEDAQPLKQQYACTHNPEHGPFSSSDAHRAVKVDGTLLKVTTEQIEVLGETEVPKGIANVQVFKAEEVEANTFAAGSVYRIQPQTNPGLYSMFCDLVLDSNLAFVCELTMRSKQKMYRIMNREGMLTLVELIRPGSFHDVQVQHAEYDAGLLAQLQQFAGADPQPFVPDEWANREVEAVEDLKRAVSDPNAPKPEPVSKVRADDPTAALAAMLATTKPAKKPRKRAAKKAAVKAA